MMIGLAFDLSLNSTGFAKANVVRFKDDFAWLDGFTYEVNLIKTAKIKDHTKKICFIVSRIKKLVKSIKPKVIFIEGQSYCSKGRSILSLAQLHGTVYYVLERMKKKYDFEYQTIPPTTVKKYVTGKGNSKKSLILKSLYKKWHLDVDNEDEADALAVLITGFHLKGII